LELARRLYRERIVPAWLSFAGVVGDFLDKAGFRVSLAWAVLLGRLPLQVERRWWNRATETPALVNVYDWTDERLVFSVLVWPSLESSEHDADYRFRQRVDEVKEAIAKGAAEKAWATLFETDYGLRWDLRRECWVASDGHAYDGSRFGAQNRRPGAVREQG
jgi:hypothetical protein